MSVEVHLRVSDDTNIPLKVDTGQVVYPSHEEIMKMAYPVGSLWATRDEDADPAEELGFGDWQKVSPGRMTWEMLQGSTWNAQGTVIGYYIWERIV